MHGCSTGSDFVVDAARVDSMGGFVEGGVGIGTKTSPRSAAIEKAYSKLRQACDGKEERRRQLEFLQEGGDPLEFISGSAASVSVQSTSLIDKHPDRFATCEVKNSANATSPHGDSVESSGRPGAAPQLCEPNSADNLMLFDGENKFVGSNVIPGQSSKFDQSQNAKELGNPSAFDVPRKAYKRRYRPRTNRDSTDKDQSSSQLPSSNDGTPVKTTPSDNLREPEVDGVIAAESTTDFKKDLEAPEGPQLSPEKERVDNQASSCQMNEFGDRKDNEKSFPKETENNGAAFGTKGLDSESSCTQPSLGLDVHNDSEMCTNRELNGSDVKVKDDINADVDVGLNNEAFNSNGSVPKSPKELVGTVSNLQSEIKDELFMKKTEDSVLKSEPSSPKNVPNVGVPKHSEYVSQPRVSNFAPEGQASRLQCDEDSILKEARIIEAKRKRIAELSAVTYPQENHKKSHWSYVLDEMAWLANDFAQERLWKITVACQICHRIAFSSQLKIQEQSRSGEQKSVAQSVTKAVMDFWHFVEGKNKKVEFPRPKKDYTLAIREYATRFLKYNGLDIPQSQTEALPTPGTSCEGHFIEENHFYPVPLGAMDAYRKSIESHVHHCEKTGSSMQEEVETSACDAVADCAYEMDEGETSTYDRSRFSPMARKIHLKAYNSRPCDVGAEVAYTPFTDNRISTHHSVLPGKRPAGSHVSIPTKRVRTASRPRVLNPFGATLLIKTENASSGDTSSFQDDQSTLHSLEVESVGDYEKHLLFDSAEVSKPKKKKNQKLSGSTYGQRWQVDSNYQTNQRDHSRKRLDSHQLESNGLFGLYNAKRPKMLVRQSLENSFENNAPIGGSPVASQMSNMSNPNKLMRMLSGRDRSRKAKTLKMPAGQPGSGSDWSLFEDQALVVLVHDMGPNWEFVSDAINSTSQFKCIYRKPNECKERHKILMDRSSGDGADSAEDSGSSQPYPSTLPGIPKGSARRLFQRLQRPMEEDTLKSHFENIIVIGKKYLLRKTHGVLKQIQQPHDSHMHALSQLCPNNLNGGPLLTPLDLCDAPSSSPDILSVGFESPNSSGLAISSQGVGSMIPASGSNSGVQGSSENRVQGSSKVVLGNNIPTSSSPLNASVRDGRYAVPRSVDEQQRLQQYNQMLSGRNMQPNAHPGGNNIGTISGFNRSPIPIPRPGFPGVASSPSSSMPSTVNVHSGVSSNKGNSMVRPRDVLHMMRPAQNQEAQKQMIVPELQIKVSQGNTQGVPPFGGLNSSFPNQTATSPVSSQPLHQQQQAYAIRLARERHLQQQRFLQQQPLPPLASSLSNTHQQLRHPFPAHGLGRSTQNGGSGLTTTIGKQRLPHQTVHQQQQQQQLQNASRLNLPQRQISESQQQAKAKVLGPNSLHQSVPSSVSGPSSNHQVLMHPQQLQQPKLMRTQSQVALPRVLPRNRAVSSDPPSKSQSGEPQSEHILQSSKITTQGCSDSTSATKVSVRDAAQGNAAELSFDSIGTPPTNSVCKETVPEVIQGSLENSDRDQVRLLARPNESRLD